MLCNRRSCQDKEVLTPRRIVQYMTRKLAEMFPDQSHLALSVAWKGRDTLLVLEDSTSLPRCAKLYRLAFAVLLKVLVEAWNIISETGKRFPTILDTTHERWPDPRSL